MNKIMGNNLIVELLGCMILLSFFFWWLLSIVYRSSLIGIIYWKDGRIEESELIFNGLKDFEEWVDHLEDLYPEEIDHIEYDFVNPKSRKLT